MVCPSALVASHSTHSTAEANFRNTDSVAFPKAKLETTRVNHKISTNTTTKVKPSEQSLYFKMRNLLLKIEQNLLFGRSDKNDRNNKQAKCRESAQREQSHIAKSDTKTIFIDRETNVIVKDNRAFFTDMSAVLNMYWELIDKNNFPFLTRKLFNFCKKVSPNTYDFEKLYKAYKYMEKRVSRAYAFITNPEGTKIFLIKNKSPNEVEVEWSFAGGKIDYDESFEECLARELKEEINIDLSIFDIKNTPHVEFVMKNRRIRVYKIIVSESRYIAKNTFEISDAKWFSVENLPHLVSIASHGLRQFTKI